MFAYSGPGCTPSEPMALAAMFSSAERGQLDAMELAASLLPSPERPVAPEARYRKCYEGRFKISRRADQII
jgi:hypothetical protein